MSTEGVRSTLQMLPAAAFLFGPDCEILDLSPDACDLLGVARETSINRSIKEWFVLPPGEPFDKDALCEGACLNGIDMKVRRSNEVEFPVTIRARITDEGMLAVFTPHKEGDPNFAGPEAELFRQITGAVNEVIWMGDPRKENMIYISPAYELIWGRTCESLYREPLSFIEAIHPSDRDRVVAAFPKQVKGDYDEAYRVVRPDGAERWVRDRAFPVRDENGEVYRIVGVATDITHRVEAEQALRESEARHRAFLDTANDGFVLIEQSTGLVREVNSALLTLIDRDESEVLNRPYLDFAAPEHKDFYESIRQGDIQSPAIFPEDVFIVRPDNCRIHVEASVANVVIQETEYLHVLLRDLTERDKVQASLEASEQQYRTLVETAMDGIILVDNDSGAILEANPAYLEMLGRTTDQVIGRSMLEFAPPEYLEQYAKTSAEEWDDDRRMFREEIFVARPDGSSTPVEVSANRFILDGKELMLCLIRDVTERRMAEDELRESEARFRAVTENALDLINIIDLQGVIQYHNPSSKEILGFEPEELVGKSAFEMLHPDDVQTATQALMMVLAEPNKTHLLEARVKHADGSWRIIQTYGRNLMSVEGLHGILLNSRDITDQKTNEEALRTARHAAEAASRAKSEFLANMSHEIRTPLNGIIGLTQQTLASKLKDQQRTNLELVSRSADALLTIINDILDFSKIEAGRLTLDQKPISLEQIVSDTVQFMQFRADSRNLDLSWEIDGSLPEYLLGDAGRIRQILVNLIGNALKFTPEGGVSIHAEALSLTGEDCTVQITVKDSGIGIPEDQIEHVFEPFSQVESTASRSHGGTGLGLTISRHLAQLMDGTLTAYSIAGDGSRFTLSLPLKISTTSPDQSDILPAVAGFDMDETSGAPGPTVRILVVEDNEVNLHLVTQLLQAWGYAYEVARSGRVALARLNRETFDLVLLDIQMPGINGFDVIAAIRKNEEETGEHLPVIAMTAYAMQDDKKKCLSAGMDDYMAKPFKPNRLRALLRMYTNTPSEKHETTSVLATHGKPIVMIRKEAARILREMRQNLKDQSQEALSRNAHTLGGIIAIFEPDSQAVKILRELSRNGNLEDVELVKAALREVEESLINDFAD